MNESKMVRKQLRNVCQELLGETLSKEMEERILTKLLSHINQRMDLIANNAKETLEKIDQRSQDVQSYVLRNSK